MRTEYHHIMQCCFALARPPWIVRSSVGRSIGQTARIDACLLGKCGGRPLEFHDRMRWWRPYIANHLAQFRSWANKFPEPTTETEARKTGGERRGERKHWTTRIEKCLPGGVPLIFRLINSLC